MIEIIGVRFKANGKVYYFSPGDHQFQTGDLVVVKRPKGRNAEKSPSPTKPFSKLPLCSR